MCLWFLIVQRKKRKKKKEKKKKQLSVNKKRKVPKTPYLCRFVIAYL